MVDTHQLLRSRRGLIAEIAQAINRTHAAVGKWQQVPAQHVATVSRLTGVPPHELRPDVFQSDGQHLAP